MDTLETDYLVVGAGAAGMAFADAVVDHADVHVTLVDRRHGPGGHWLDAYPFVRLHQASQFYGVASRLLGGGSVQTDGPEAGLHERATADQIRTYYQQVLADLERSGRVTFLGGHLWEQRGDQHVVRSVVSGVERAVRVRRRLVDAAYLSPTVPATTPPPFAVAPDVRTIPVNGLVDLTSAPDELVVVGAGKTATDAIVWLLDAGLDPDRIVWVRPRDPWMLDRARVQPDALSGLSLAEDVLRGATEASDLTDLFLRLEDAGVLMRVDGTHTPTMARTPTLGRWELERLRRVERVVRRGHVRGVRRGELTLSHGTVPIAPGALVVHCAASGIVDRPMVPIWGEDRIAVQTVRAGAPTFCAALVGYVEATRDDDVERNRLCPPNLYGNSRADWARMMARGTAAAATYGAEPDVAAFVNACALNPARITPDEARRPEVQAAVGRVRDLVTTGQPALAALATTG